MGRVSQSSSLFDDGWRDDQSRDPKYRSVEERDACAVGVARRIYALAARRERRLGADLFSNPGWLMLLDLFVSESEGRRLSVTALCLGSRKPLATALRYVAVLCDAGLTKRSVDAVDARRSFVSLTDKGRRDLVALLLDDN